MRTSALRLLAATAAFIAVSSVQAADLPSRFSPAPAYDALPVFTWSGFYAGVNLGYGRSSGVSQYYDPAFNVTGGRRKSGFVGGVQGGYNYQLGMFVVGAEADLQYAAIGDKGATYLGTYYRGEEEGYFGTVRARAGLAVDRALVFGSLGFAYGDLGGNKDLDAALGYRRDDSTSGGWTLGGGLEYAVTDNFTAKLEGLYVNLDTSDSYSLAGRVNIRRDTEFSLFRAGLNYKFN
ncbi:outer membrane protein [Microvirga makkahensis]|uniref:Outer membrane beta-barrel protein n=1 Tax=Microvirga makkahensis TaxID=1128670 RepID=A0A7X3MWB9_9HYPH|nr:outer membrane beta-barrel protein [Microvirga makkahensis]MXQ14429.1 outer membrane beta-barrel protein [Microvirga makkahensis]